MYNGGFTASDDDLRDCREYNAATSSSLGPALELSDIFLGVVELGLPVALLSWLLFYRLYFTGELPRDADSKGIRAGLKQIKKSSKKADRKSRDVLHTKWMKFGGGFYGVAALWTFVFIEAQGVIATVAHPSSIGGMFDDGLLGFVVAMLVNQFTTFITALVWFSYWANEGHGMFTWALIAYGGYALGLNAARYEVALASQVLATDWRSHFRDRLGRLIGPDKVDPDP